MSKDHGFLDFDVHFRPIQQVLTRNIIAAIPKARMELNLATKGEISSSRGERIEPWLSHLLPRISPSRGPAYSSVQNAENIIGSIIHASTKFKAGGEHEKAMDFSNWVWEADDKTEVQIKATAFRMLVISLDVLHTTSIAIAMY